MLPWPIDGLHDSKKLSAKRREALAATVRVEAAAYGLGWVMPKELDEIGMSAAVKLAMQRAVAVLPVQPDCALVDGNRAPDLPLEVRTIIKGDAQSASIAAASILAKVSRDRYMCELDKQFPQYQLAKHKGYPTALHYALIEQYGIQPFYRRSFLKKQGYWPEDK